MMESNSLDVEHDVVPILIMSYRGAIALLMFSFLALGACSKHKPDPALQSALDELKRLNSITEAGLTYSEYSDRLLTAKGNIDVALQRTPDQSAKANVEQAVRYYLDARNAWKHKIDKDYKTSLDTEDYWTAATEAAGLAAKYATEGAAARQQIEAKLKDLDHRIKAEEKGLRDRLTEEVEAERKQVEEETKTREEARRKDEEARWKEEAAETERQRKAAAAETERLVKEAERERERKFAPEGTVYNLKATTVPIEGGLATIPPGTELTVTMKNADGSFRVKWGDLATNVLPDAVTNDRDLAGALRSNDQNAQELLRQLNAQRAAEAAEQERQKYAEPTPTPDQF